MKLSTYHKRLGDDVSFVKGCPSWTKLHYWDSVYISTLFTYTWKETAKTISDYKTETLFGAARKIYVGGILASLMPDRLSQCNGYSTHSWNFRSFK